MDEEKIEKYDLNLKLIFFILAVCIGSVCFSLYIIFFSSLQEALHYQAIIMIATGEPVYAGSGILLIPYIIYLIALVVYKRRNVLIIYENKIEYYNLLKGKMIIEKKAINDIYISEKLVVKYNENNKTKTLSINLIYIKCDKDEMRKALINLKPQNDIIKNIVSNVLKQYSLKDINQLKEHKEAFEECVIKLYKLNELTQQELASLLNTNPTKVSKIIRKTIEL